MSPALLFDLDGTMIESDPIHAAVFREVFAERGREIDGQFYTDRIQGRLNEDIFTEFFPGEDADALADEKEARFRDRLGGSADPMPGLLTLMDRARGDGLAIGIVTNAPRLNAEAMLSAIGLDGRFDTLVVCEDCPAASPTPCPTAPGSSASAPPPPMRWPSRTAARG